MISFLYLGACGDLPINQSINSNNNQEYIDSVEQVRLKEVEMEYFDSIAFIAYKKVLTEIQYENFEKSSRQDTTYRLFIFSGSVGSVAEIFTLEKHNGKINLTFDACVLVQPPLNRTKSVKKIRDIF